MTDRESWRGPLTRAPAHPSTRAPAHPSSRAPEQPQAGLITSGPFARSAALLEQPWPRSAGPSRNPPRERRRARTHYRSRPPN